jgi:hypothetical protein
VKIALEVPPGLNTDDTAYAASPAWADGSNMRFRLGRPQTIGGWEGIIATALTGVCRTVFNWTDNNNTLNIAFGTHSALQLYQGGSLYTITPSSGFTAGQIDGTGSTGWGTGAYGIGDYGEPSATDYFPLTWSFGAYGQTLIANPRGQGIFQWSNNTANVAVTVTNAPAVVTYCGVAPTRQIFAFGCSEEVGGAFNPLCIRHSSIADATDWTTTSSSASTAREYVLPGGGRIVAARLVGRNWLVWTNHGLWVGTYYGQIGRVWSFDKVGDKCGLIGPNAAAVLGSTAYWVSPDRQFHSYSLGGVVMPIACPVREEFGDNLASSQGDKVVASSIAEYGEIRWDYPDSRDGYENSRYVALAVEGNDAGNWYKGEMARTAMVDAGPSSYPIGVTYGGMTYFHEKGNSADGGILTSFIETADIYLDENLVFLTRSVWPDIADQVGPVALTMTTRFYAQGDATASATYSVAPGQDTVDFKTKGRLFRFKFAGASAPSYFRIGRILVDGKPGGRK